MLPQKLSLKRSNTLHLFLSILFTVGLIYFSLGPYEKTRIIFKTNFFAAIIFILFFLAVTIYSWYNLFNKKSILTFETIGITYKKKSIHWQNIKSYKTINYQSDTIDSLQLVLTLSNSNNEYIIPLFGLDTDEQQIRAYINNNSTSPIIDEGHFDKN